MLNNERATTGIAILGRGISPEKSHLLHRICILTVTHTHARTTLTIRSASASKITLVSPDPNTQTHTQDYDTVHNRSHTVTFTPNTILRAAGTAESVQLELDETLARPSDEL